LQRLQKVVDRSDSIVVATGYVRNDLKTHLACPGEPEVITLGVTDLSLAPQEPVAALEGKSFLFHISRLAPSKGVSFLMGLARLCPTEHFVLAGPASAYSENVQAELREQPTPNITLLTDVSAGQKAWLYQHCRAFLFPSLTEGFGLPPLEAMCFGKPVFLSNRTCLPEIGGPYAHYWDTLEPAAMKQVLETGLAAQDMSPDSIQKHGRSFTWERCAQQYEALYLKTLGINHV
jgi:glycosyltransferase involved in cell wall biosynthesis